MNSTNIVILVVSGLEQEKGLIPFDLDSQLLFIADVAITSLQQLQVPIAKKTREMRVWKQVCGVMNVNI